MTMSRLKTACYLLLNKPKLLIAQILLLNHNRFKSDELYLKLYFYFRVGYKLDLVNPITFNQKLQWLKLYDRKDIYTTMVDKYLVKDYVKQIIGEKYVIPTIGVWNTAEEIDWDSLPFQFVLKTTHDGGGGGVIICKNKNELSKETSFIKLSKSLNRDVYTEHREWPYKNVKRKIIAEAYISDGTDNPLRDYKVMCFNGVAKLVQVHKGRFSNHTQDFYDTHWVKQPFDQGSLNSTEEEPKPAGLEEMILLSERLSKNIPFLRVDWYIVNGRLFFGELTFFDASGFDEFSPFEYNKILGDWITLPDKTINN